jgi:hypothetical protein
MVRPSGDRASAPPVDRSGSATSSGGALERGQVVTTTERYDNRTLANLQVAAAKLERGLGFEALAEAGPVQPARPAMGEGMRVERLAVRDDFRNSVVRAA